MNNFSDITRFNLCGSAKTAEEASSIMDLALGLVTVFHMIEWLRWLVFCTSATVGVDLIKVYYALSVISIPYGIIVMLIAIGTRFAGGSACAADGQEERARYLLL